MPCVEQDVGDLELRLELGHNVWVSRRVQCDDASHPFTGLFDEITVEYLVPFLKEQRGASGKKRDLIQYSARPTSDDCIRWEGSNEPEQRQVARGRGEFMQREM